MHGNFHPTDEEGTVELKHMKDFLGHSPADGGDLNGEALFATNTTLTNSSDRPPIFSPSPALTLSFFILPKVECELPLEGTIGARIFATFMTLKYGVLTV